ncbi:hypothetical protein AAFF_G00267050 [Aldrovandia affinis]|uniref:XK-related protein n=1 Tax=Aldrovandia affinis TaxID=143900 RepID=A0AAD7RB31_9TELE|nr:hypothetical protein AAFF_G00267050 [Aldrovandia affinis]
MRTTRPFSYPAVDFLMTLLGLGLFVLDVVLDLVLLASLCRIGEFYLLTVLAVLLLVSSVLVQVFSWLWYRYDTDRPRTSAEAWVERAGLLGLCHVLQLAVFLRYAALVETALRSFGDRRTDLDLEGVSVYLTHDLNMLRLFETFFESAPQLLLMVLIIIRQQEAGLLTVAKAVGSAASISWTVLMYHRSLRSFLVDKTQQSYASSALYFLWNLLLIAPRVAALALLGSALPCLVPAHFLCLWLPLFLWAWLQRTDFMDSVGGEWLYRGAVALVWYFSWFSVAEGEPGRSLIYHAFMAADGALLLAVWWTLRDDEPAVFLAAIPLSYILGLLLKALYYRHAHPSLARLQAPPPDATARLIAHENDEVDSLPQPPVSDRCIEAPPPPTVQPNKRMRRLATNFYS